MPSDTQPSPPTGQRLHPLSLFFILGSLARRMLIPIVFLLIAAMLRSGDDTESGWGNYERILAFMFVPAAIFSFVRYYSMRYRFDDGEIVVNEGILKRTERHIPYTRIQNIDITQGIVQRLFRVAEASVETASGTEPEARFKVLSLASIDDMRRRVFADRRAMHQTVATDQVREGAAPPYGGPAAGAEVEEFDGAPVADSSSAAAATAAEALPTQAQETGAAPSDTQTTVAQIPLRELVVLGAFSGKGWVAAAALFGASQAVIDWDQIEAFVANLPLPELDGEQGAWAIALGICGAALLLVLLSIAFTVTTFYGFVLRREGPELRTQLGLFTRRTSTVPRQRIQMLHVERRWWMRLSGRGAIRVETAGGTAGESASGREWLIPVGAVDELPDILTQANEDASLANLSWQPLHPQAIRRSLRLQTIAVLTVATAIAAIFSSGWGLLGAAILPPIWLSTVANLRWTAYAITDRTIVYRHGWPRRRTSILPFNKIQSVVQAQSPFDRRWGMTSVLVDTASQGGIRIPYLPTQTGDDLYQQLQHEAAGTTFQW